MNSPNIIALVVGIIVLLIGIFSFINPNISRLINIPGGDHFKAIAASIVGVIIIIASFIL